MVIKTHNFKIFFIRPTWLFYAYRPWCQEEDSCKCLHPPTSFPLPDLFVVLQETLYQPSFALIRLFRKIMHFRIKTILASHQSCDVAKEIRVWKLQTAIIFLVSEETKFEVDTTSIILSHLYHFGNVNKELFKYC